MTITSTAYRVQIHDLGKFGADAFIMAAIRLGGRWREKSKMLSFHKKRYASAAQSLNAQFGCNMPYTFMRVPAHQPPASPRDSWQY